MEDITTYCPKQYLAPFWKGNAVFGESVTVIEDYFGEIRPKRLAFPITRVIAVRSADLGTKYEEGRDFRVNEYGELEILRGGKIPYLKWEDYRLKEADPKSDSQLPSSDGIGAYILAELFREREGMRAYQLAVTYEHEKSERYAITKGKKEKFTRFFEKLKSGKATVVSYGDSITYGWAASGMHDIQKPPFCPMYADMVVSEIAEHCHAEVEHKNLAVSGMCADWGMKEENLRRVAEAKPDLVILAFGMNDAGVFRPETFKNNLLAIISGVRKELPFVDFLLVSPIVPNPLIGFAAGSSIRHYHDEYPYAFYELERELKGVGYANVTAVHKLLLERKELCDTLSNNGNHPNDFMHRVYAQVILTTLFGD